MPQYIGITGFTTQGQLAGVYSGAGARTEVFFGEEHETPYLMAGVLASRKTLYGEETNNGRYPQVEDIASIFCHHSDLINLIHYNSRSEGDDLLRELLLVREYGGACCDGLQLNMVFPPRSLLTDYYHEHRNDLIVLQINNKMFSAVNDDPAMLVERVLAYLGIGLQINILLDRSGGEGKFMDIVEIRRFVEEFHKAGITEGVGIAGGLSAQNVAMLRPLLAEYPYLSLDAEGALHTGEKKDILDTELAVGYVAATLDMMGIPG